MAWCLVKYRDNFAFFLAVPFEVIPLPLVTASAALAPLLENIAEILGLELGMCRLPAILNRNDVIISPSLQCQLEFWGGKKKSLRVVSNEGAEQQSRSLWTQNFDTHKADIAAAFVIIVEEPIPSPPFHGTSKQKCWVNSFHPWERTCNAQFHEC
jgi:hypothetical protein